MILIAKIVLAALTFGMMNTSVVADEYPSRPIRIIAPMAAGGRADTAARVIADALARQLGQTVIVENRSGASGIIGTEAAARAPADGYTLLVSMAATFSIIPAVKKASYDPMTDFVPLGQIVYSPLALLVSSRSNFKSVADMVAYAKANPGKLSFASSGSGTMVHLAMEVLSREAGISLLHVPYRSGGQGVASVLGGQVDAVFSDALAVASHVQAGALRALAVTSPERLPLLPNVPTMAEAGLPRVRTINWFGLHALASTPPAVLDRLRAAVRAAQLDPAFKGKSGSTTGTVGAEAYAEMIREEAERLAPIVRSLGITFD